MEYLKIDTEGLVFIVSVILFILISSPIMGMMRDKIIFEGYELPSTTADVLLWEIGHHDSHYDCWCELWSGNPMVREHSEKCAAIREYFTKVGQIG